MVQAAVSPAGPTRRVASPERWQNAAQRAIAEGIQVRQVNTSGMWVANSGSQANVAYLLEITGTIVQSCSCPAGTFGDPCCKHAARFYLDIGVLHVDDPEPDPPALGASVSCIQCNGCGQEWHRGGFALPCSICGGAGVAPMTAHAESLRAAA